MDPAAGIYRESKVYGPHTVKEPTLRGQVETRLGCYTYIYIPIPHTVFKSTDTRAFDINVGVMVSVGGRPPVQLRNQMRLTFSHFGSIQKSSDGMTCALMK